MALTHLSPNVNGTPLPRRESTFNPFTYRGPRGDDEGKQMVAALRAMYPEIAAAADERERTRRLEAARADLALVMSEE